jgi:hypothetical protein
VAIVLLDVGVQAVRPGTPGSRLNTATSSASLPWSAGGWSADTTAEIVLGCCILAV